jgi:hypothetical protein
VIDIDPPVKRDAMAFLYADELSFDLDALRIALALNAYGGPSSS